MIDVTCAVIRDEEERVLVVQHGGESDHPWLWEFPGGKVKRGEDPEECIIREIEEELSISVVICHSLTEVVHDYGFRKIRLIPFVCDTIESDISLAEHAAYNWTEAVNLLNYSLTEADIPVAREYVSLFAGASGEARKDEDAFQGTEPDYINSQLHKSDKDSGIDTELS
ncbi:MAG: NUDIX domain-containing protein [Bacteroidales bacterium]|nr:NUDIX domain-containing protein [Bacteroidales bacterium]